MGWGHPIRAAIDKYDSLASNFRPPIGHYRWIVVTNLNTLNSAKWAHVMLSEIMDAIEKSCDEREACTGMRTGGKSALALYKAWLKLPGFSSLKNIHFYFGDERCVPPYHVESNYGLAVRTLFQHGVPPSCNVFRIPAEYPDREATAKMYEAQLPERLDILLLSMGEDGHIASLFPHSSALFETRRRMVHVMAPRPPFARLTVTPSVITGARHVFVMALGAAKASTFREARLAPYDIAGLPARLVLNAKWFLGNL